MVAGITAIVHADVDMLEHKKVLMILITGDQVQKPIIVQTLTSQTMSTDNQYHSSMETLGGII